MHNRTGIGILIGIEIQVNPIWYFIIHWNYDKNDRNNPDLIHRIIYERHWPQPMDGVWVISHDPKRGFTHQQTNTDMVIEFTTFNTNLSLIHLILIIFIVTVLIRWWLKLYIYKLYIYIYHDCYSYYHRYHGVLHCGVLSVLSLPPMGVRILFHPTFRTCYTLQSQRMAPRRGWQWHYLYTLW